ncbi:MAG TPA: hypothetical protein DCF68_16450 [Cyanothece sp. UBA12306]|nr:hypothetical protein [Cyanothece sp. UBA12306]
MEIPGELKILVYTEPTDMRKSFNGLAGIVNNVLGDDPLSGSVYVFFNRLHKQGIKGDSSAGGPCPFPDRGYSVKLAAFLSEVVLADTALEILCHLFFTFR